MDFMKWISSLDEFLYEIMSWLLFYPFTLWRAVTSPVQTMRTVETQETLPADQQFADLLSPPLFLALSLLLAHAIAVTLNQPDEIIANRHGLAALVDDAASALVLRVVVFASFPLFLASRLVRRCGGKLDRISLRRPFYEQCFPGAVLALGVSSGTNLLSAGGRWDVFGYILIISTITFFMAIETRWFAIRGNGKHARAAASVAIGLLEGALFLLIVGFAFTR